MGIIASHNVQLSNSVIMSGDDNVVIKEGSSMVDGEHLTLMRGKGIAIGSLGEQGASNQVITDISFRNVHLDRCAYGARIKTWMGGHGVVRNISFESFQLKDVRTGVLIDQKYCPLSQKPEGCVGGADPSTPAVALRDVRFKDFTGSVSKTHKVDCQRCSAIEFQGGFARLHSRASMQQCDCCCSEAEAADIAAAAWPGFAMVTDVQLPGTADNLPTSKFDAAARRWVTDK